MSLLSHNFKAHWLSAKIQIKMLTRSLDIFIPTTRCTNIMKISWINTFSFQRYISILDIDKKILSSPPYKVSWYIDPVAYASSPTIRMQCRFRLHLYIQYGFTLWKIVRKRNMSQLLIKEDFKVDRPKLAYIFSCTYQYLKLIWYAFHFISGYIPEGFVW